MITNIEGKNNNNEIGELDNTSAGIKNLILSFFLHNFYRIFLVYNNEISRPQKICLFYLKINLLIAISGLFSQ
jgi:hypothetical protein